MDPMGFYESILFAVMVSLVHGIAGWAFVTIHPRYDSEHNLAIKCGAAVVWPIIAAIVTARGLYAFMGSVFSDAKKLILPRKHNARIPKRVTVEMLAAERGKEYVPGQWANDV